MAHQLGLKTVAEGVETIEHLKLLRELGCDYGQGYYFSKPLPARHCRSLLEQLSDERRFTETLKMRAFRNIA
jgi:EAL domain-containing protein (putative c-di-GMP-specific phosphodiesterase class I)